MWGFKKNALFGMHGTSAVFTRILSHKMVLLNHSCGLNFRVKEAFDGYMTCRTITLKIGWHMVDANRMQRSLKTMHD